jgi:GntR family histidine utilization transcriptional repressor
LSAPEINSWKLVRDEVVRRINTRVWPPGDFIPGEAELAEQFGCARTTVNRALRELALAGLVTRRRKAGTRVSLNPVRKATLYIPITRLEVEQRGCAYAHALLERKRKKPSLALRRQLGLAEDQAMLFMRALHRADGRPYIYEERWINTDIVPEIEAADCEAISANEWLVVNAPFTHGDIAFSAANASAREAELLATADGAAVFIAERTTWNGIQPITSVRMVYAPGYRMETAI